MSDRRYTLLAPIYDAVLRLSGLNAARRRSIDLLKLQLAERVLLVGAGTGLDLEHLDVGVRVYASDVTPAMLRRLNRRAVAGRVKVHVQVMDSAALGFRDESFDAVILHLVLAVVPRPVETLREVERVLKPRGRVVILDKFIGAASQRGFVRRLFNPLARVTFSDLNRELESMLSATTLSVERDIPVAFGGAYRAVLGRK